MIDLEALYFEWLLRNLDPDGVSEEVAFVSGLLHSCTFERRVGNDYNRAADGLQLRLNFLDAYSELDVDPHVEADFMVDDCSWLEMMVALASRLDFLYEGGVEGQFMEMVTNLGLDSLMTYSHQHTPEAQEVVETTVGNVDRNNFKPNGYGGLYPLQSSGYPDQREVEIWDQAATYFFERVEGV